MSICYLQILSEQRFLVLMKFFQESCLLEQTYIKDSDKKVNDVIKETIATLGENISISRFSRFAIGESSLT